MSRTRSHVFKPRDIPRAHGNIIARERAFVRASYKVSFCLFFCDQSHSFRRTLPADYNKPEVTNFPPAEERRAYQHSVMRTPWSQKKGQDNSPWTGVTGGDSRKTQTSKQQWQVARKRDKHRQEEKETEMKWMAKTCKNRTKQT